MAGMLVRASRVSDAPRIASLTNYYIRETSIHFGTQEVEPGYFADQIDRDADRYPWLTAEIDGDFAGFAKSGLWRERAAYARTVETAVYVERAHQSRGVGRALYEQLFRELVALGYHMAVAGVTLPNDASVRLHEGVGFAFVGRFSEVGRKFEQWHDVGWWQRML